MQQSMTGRDSIYYGYDIIVSTKSNITKIILPHSILWSSRVRMQSNTTHDIVKMKDDETETAEDDTSKSVLIFNHNGPHNNTLALTFSYIKNCVLFVRRVAAVNSKGIIQEISALKFWNWLKQQKNVHTFISITISDRSCQLLAWMFKKTIQSDIINYLAIKTYKWHSCNITQNCTQWNYNNKNSNACIYKYEINHECGKIRYLILAKRKEKL